VRTSTPVLAAGAVVWRMVGDAVDVLLVHRPRYDDWSFPKGKLDPGEHVLTAAVREAAEETGLTIRLGLPLPTQEYDVSGVATRV
jgi:8-oxo-(d)GTP phosphatase